MGWGASTGKTGGGRSGGGGSTILASSGRGGGTSGRGGGSSSGGSGYGDLIAAVLALVALMTLRSRLRTLLVWGFNVWGSADLAEQGGMAQ